MRAFILALVLTTPPVIAEAASIITFDAGPPWSEELEEAGFRYQNSSTYRDGPFLYLHDDSGVTSSTFRRSDGGLFDALSVDLRGYSKLFVTELGPSPDGDDFNTYEHQSGETIHLSSTPIVGQISGHRSGSRVSLLEFAFDSILDDYWSLDFGTEFRDLDALTFSLLVPDPKVAIFDTYSVENRPLGSVFCGDSWCGGLQADNLRVSLPAIAAAPLPAGGLPFAGGIVLLLVAGWLRRRAYCGA